MAFPPKKKSGMDVAVVVKPHGLGAPLPVEKTNGAGPGKGMGPTPEHEAAEAPADESSEEYGQKLISDIEAVGEQYGADAATSHKMAAAFLGAIAKCLQSDEEGGEGEGEQGGMGGEAEQDDMQGGYGR